MRKSSDEGHTFGIKKIINSAGVFPLVEVSSDNKVHLSWTEWKSYPNEIDFLYERSLNQGTSFSCSKKLKASTTEFFNGEEVIAPSAFDSIVPL